MKNSMTVRGTLIPNMNPYDEDSDNSILVLDNCCIHHVGSILTLLQQSGILVQISVWTQHTRSTVHQWCHTVNGSFVDRLWEGVALPGVIVLNELLCQPHAEGLEDLLPVGGV